MQDAGIVRNRAKIEATVALARIVLDLAEKGGFARHLWSFVDGRPIAERAASRTDDAEPRTTCLAPIAKDLRGARRQFLSGRRSSTPSCRRSAWSTTISSIAAVTRPARRWRASPA